MLRRPRTLRLNRLPGSASQQGGPCISSSTTLALEARNLKARVSAPLRLKGLHREGHTLAWARTGGGGAVLTVGSSSFFPASWAPCLPHPRPGPGLSGCIFSKGQSGRRGANRFVPGHRRIQGHASQPGKYPFPPPNFLIVQGHRCGGCHHKSERSRHPKSSPDYSSAHYPKGSRTVWLHCRLLIGTRARQRLIC